MENCGGKAILVGGSTAINQIELEAVVKSVKTSVTSPVILFPGNVTGVAPSADAIFFSCLMNSDNSGFDTHAAQEDTHSGLLSEFAGAVAAFFEDLQAANLSERVALLAFSEFGRTIRENGSAGTDHGTAGVVFLAGPGVRGSVAGNMPSLTDLGDGEPKMTTDFRRIYTSVLESWVGISSHDAAGGSFEPAALFRS